MLAANKQRGMQFEVRIYCIKVWVLFRKGVIYGTQFLLF